MSSQILFSWDEVSEITGGRWAGRGVGPAGEGISAVTDDSRNITTGSLFVAVRGEIADGHDYVQEAISAGAAAVCTEDCLSVAVVSSVKEAGIPRLIVEDGLSAFQKLARAYRRRFPELCVVGITGSCGKTSTKEMTAAVLEKGWAGQVLKTEGNTNNHFGVPRNLFRISSEHRFAVIEMGSNHPGEIASLAAIAEPNIGVVSNIGRAHLEFLGDLTGVAHEKGALLSGIHSNGTAVIPSEADCPRRDVLLRMAGDRKTFVFGTGDDADLRAEYLGQSGETSRARLFWRNFQEEHILEWRYSGEYQVLNATAAAAVGTVLGLSPEVIVRGLRECRLPHMRMEMLEHRGVHWLNDAYNANPDSMRAAIKTFAELTGDISLEDRLVVVGDMLELGDASEFEHLELLQWIRHLLPEAALLVVGEAMSAAAGEICEAAFPDASKLKPVLYEKAVPGTWVFLKASRGIRLEQVMPGAEDLDNIP